jgi:hypothetical protein
MTYIKVGWLHSFPNDPVFLYSELDADRWEVRKVEVYADGRMEYAGRGKAVGGAKLGKVPVPPLEEIANHPEFKPELISEIEFEAIWSKAVGR